MADKDIHAEKSEAASENKAHNEEIEQPAHQPWPKRFGSWLAHHKRFVIPAAVLFLLGVVAAIPFTRYAAAGIFLQQTYTVSVIDADTNKAVSSATVRLAGKETKTDSKGQASVRTNVGEAKLEISKKYYRTVSQEVLVPFKKHTQPFEIKLQATGRTVPVTVLNKISKQPLENAVVKAGGAEARTNKKGEAIIVVPAAKQELKATVTKDTFNTIDVTLQVTGDAVPANTFQLTPAGKIYFLSNQSGKVDVTKSDLDGANRQTVLPGTGKEDKLNTVLLASRDWKYIGLLSKRDGGQYAKLFLIEAGNDKLTVIDEGEASFNLYGWSGDRLIYSVYREKVGDWEPKHQALKSYSASAKKITTIDDTGAEGTQAAYVAEQLGGVYVLGQEVVFVKNWTWGGNALALSQTKQATLYTAKADGAQKKTVKSYPANFIDTKTAEFGEIYVQYADGNKSKFEAYKGGKAEATNLTDSEFYNESYPVYAVSPSGKKTLWSDYRDGKNVFFVGNDVGEDGKQVGQSEDYNVYGWFTDDYILLTKKGSELRIMPADGIKDGVEASTKVSDYFKPNYAGRGFGFGYGG